MKLDASTQDSEATRSQLAETREELDLAQESLERATGSSASLRNTLHCCREDLKMSRRHVSRLKESKATLKATVNDLRDSDKISNLNQKSLSSRSQAEDNAALRSQITELTTKLATAEAENTDLESRLTLPIDNAMHLRSFLDDAHLKITQLQLSNIDLTR